MFSLEQVKQSHPHWNQLVKQYDYLYRSYLGGKEYRDGAYLRKYLNEDAGPGNQYLMRLLNTPLYNYCKTTVDVYRSFLFRIPPTRRLGDYVEDVEINDFIADADHDGRNLTAFMKTIADRTAIFGSMWVLVDRPAYQATTRAEEIMLGIRPYVTAYHPDAIMDWRYEEQPNGAQELSYIKVIEEAGADQDVLKIWTPTTVTKLVVEKTPMQVYSDMQGFDTGVQRNQFNPYTSIISQEEYVNPLGYVPFINVVTEAGLVKGTGISLLGDVADLQRSIYNKLSGLEQTIRISGHPTLVKSADTEAAAGAGAIITMPDNLPGDLRPFLLQPTGASIDGILRSIDEDIKAINDITHLQAVKATTGSPMSGVALQTEFQQLNSRLSDIADMLEEAEIAIWEIYFDWQGMEWPEDFEIKYEKSFDLRDKHSDLELMRKGLEIIKDKNLTNFEASILKQVANIVLEKDEDIQETEEEIESTYEEELAPPADAQAAMAEIADEGMIDGCPIPMTDKSINIANHLECVAEANLGPASVTNPGTFWLERADRLGITEQVSRTQTCANCAFYVNTPAIKSCFTNNMAAGNIPLATEVDPTWENVSNPAGYCVKWDITCTPTRTCDTWVTGGPIE